MTVGEKLSKKNILILFQLIVSILKLKASRLTIIAGEYTLGNMLTCQDMFRPFQWDAYFIWPGCITIL